MRRTTSVLVVAALVLGAAGCGGDDDAAEASMVESSASRATTGPDDAAVGADAVRRVGTSLYAPFAEAAADGNLAFSPVSITLALGMTRAGAQGESAAQLDELLGTDDAAVLHRGLNAVDATMAGLVGKTTDAAGRDAEIDLSMANSLWGQVGATWEDPFLDLLKAEYGVGVHTVDYVADAADARDQVNGWVAEETHDLIPDLIAEGDFDQKTRLTLVNALYLAAPWDEELDDKGDQPFTTAAGDDVSVPMLGHSGLYPYQRGDGWQAITLPYAGGELAMTLLVPDAGGLDAVEAALDGDLLERVLTAAPEPEVVMLSLPRFDLASEPALGAALKRIGVTAPFSTETDFTPMSTDPAVQPLQLADALHQATVTIDEHGTVASAATATTFEKVGAAISEKELTIDRPFLFAIHDVATATPLFLGRVTDPRAE